MSVKVAKFETKGHFSRVFYFFYYIKQIDSMLPCVCSVIDHRGRQNVVRTSVTHSAAPRVPLFCSYHILTSSVIYYWTDARQHGIYLLNGLLLLISIRTENIWACQPLWYRHFSLKSCCSRRMKVFCEEYLRTNSQVNCTVRRHALHCLAHALAISWDLSAWQRDRICATLRFKQAQKSGFTLHQLRTIRSRQDDRWQI